MSTARAIALAAALSLAAPLALGAQEIDDRAVDLDVRGGVTLPAGDLADMGEAAGAIGLGAGYWLTDRIAIRADGDVGFLSGDPLHDGSEIRTSFPRMRLWNYVGGVEVSVLERHEGENPWSVTVDAGVGATTLDTEKFGTSRDDVTETWLSSKAGLEVGYDATRNLDVVVGSEAQVAFADEADTERLAALSQGVEPLETVWSFPVTAELRFELP